MKIDNKGIEAGVTKRLAPHLDKAEISQVAKLIAVLTEKGIRIDDVFPYGIPTIFDAVSIRGNLDAKQLGQLAELMPTLGQVKDYHIFTRGILAPDGFRMHLNVTRNSVQK